MKLLIAALLAVFSTSVLAEWTMVGGGNDAYIGYADLSTIRKSGNKVKMWNLMDLKVVRMVNGTRFLSMTNQFEYDCKEETMRRLALNAYAKNMGQGEPVFTSGAMHEEPQPIPPGTEAEGLFKVACGK